MHLYLHVPFCARRCSYCDFAIAVRRTIPSEAYVESVLKEWEHWLPHPAWGNSPTLETIYFGGGTPSLLSSGALSRILDRVRQQRPVSAEAEITLEANPDDVTPDAARAWREAGINRVSLGVQSFEPPVLQWMHRTHRAEQVPAAVTILRGAGFTNLSLDLIFGLPAELERRWEADLERALTLQPDHLSVYGLTVESHTPLAHWIGRGENVPVDEVRYAGEFLAADQLLTSAGYQHYEVSNYGRPGRRARHNSAYWQRAPYIGLGPSSHSGFGHDRQWNLREWSAYQRAVARGESPVAGREQLDADARRLEDLYLALRTSDGLPAEAIPIERAHQWLDQGWLRSAGDGTRLALTPEGWLRMDALVATLSSHSRPSPVSG